MSDHDGGTIAPAALREQPADSAEEAFFSSLAGPDAERLVANARCTMQVRRVRERSMPISVSRPGFEGRNSYVCSPYGAFVTYSLDELALIGDARLRAAFGVLIRAFGLVLRACRVDRAVGLNNWLLSTNPLCGWNAGPLSALADVLVRDYPTHYLILRSVNAFEHSETLAGLIAAGWTAIPIRQVYYLEVGGSDLMRAKNIRRDFNLADRTNYRPVTAAEFEDADLRRCAVLYAMVNRVKHSVQNPAFTEAYIQACYASRAFTFLGWRDRDGVLAAFAIMHVDGDVATIPFMGYDTDAPQDHGLYRLFFVSIVKQAQGAGVRWINCGAGVGAFKTSRGARPHTEYTLIFDRHLLAHRRWHYGVIGALMRKLAVPLMLKYGL